MNETIIYYKLIGYDSNKELLDLESCFGEIVTLHKPSLMLRNGILMSQTLTKFNMPSPMLEIVNAQITLFDGSDGIIKRVNHTALDMFECCYKYNIKMKVLGLDTGNIIPTTEGIQFLANTKSKTMIIPREAIEINRYKTPGKNLTKAIINGGIEVIPKEYFMLCNNLVELQMPASLRFISDFSFMRTKIKELKFPDSLVSIGDGAFKYSDNLQELNLSNTSVRSIGTKAFEGCLNLKKVVLSKNLKTLTVGMFSLCHSLEFIRIQSEIKKIQHFLPEMISGDKLIIEAPYCIKSGLDTYIKSLHYYNKILIKYYNL